MTIGVAVRHDGEVISVIIPVYNNESTVELAIRSIQNQTHADLEIIAVDDHSTDGSMGVLQRIARDDPRLVVCKTTNSPDPVRTDKDGVNTNAGYAARNTGLDRSKGEWVAFQDADDVSLLNRLEVQLSLAHRFGADHVTVSCFWFEPRHVDCYLDLDSFERDNPLDGRMVGPDTLHRLARRGQGWLARWMPDWVFRAVPFTQKRRRAWGRLFFGHWENYPGTAGAALVNRSALDGVRFRRLADRRWPSVVGRGVDRDFNFRLADRRCRSVFVDVPLYAWRTPSAFKTPYGLGRYLIPSKPIAKKATA